MKNVTITLDEELAGWARVEAAKAGVSLSRYLADVLAERRAGRSAPALTQREALDHFLSGPGYPGIMSDWRGREELYAEREDKLLRRHKRSSVRAGSKLPGETKKGRRMAQRDR